MNVTVETISPKTAEAWLNSNKSNRRLRDGLVEKYAGDMKQGRWTECPEPITFYEDGDLADGQHRLWAIVESGVTIQFSVYRGLSRRAGLNINTGAGRTVIDNARISGTNDSLTPAIISCAKAHEFGDVVNKGNVSNASTLAIVEAYRSHVLFAASAVRRKQGLCGSAVMGGISRAHMHGETEEKLRRFCDVLATGLYDGDKEVAAIVLRNYLMAKGGTSHSTALWRDTFLKVQLAISHFCKGKKINALRTIQDEAYPPAEKKVKAPSKPRATPKPIVKAAARVAA